jgi:hypothetical protein
VIVGVGRAESVLDADAAERAALARLQACVCHPSGCGGR